MPEPYTTFSSKLIPLPAENVDTDQIIPARFLKTTEKSGLASALFNDWRYLADGSPNPDFVLNRPEMQGRQVLLVGDNFGAGSSREHAPWALTAWGIKAIISTSYADIFQNNSMKNGLLPIVVDPATHQRITRHARRRPRRGCHGGSLGAGAAAAGWHHGRLRGRPLRAPDDAGGHRRDRLGDAPVSGHRRLGVAASGPRGHPARPGPGRLKGDDMTADPNVVRKLYEARQGTDLEAAADLIAPDVIWHEPYEYLGTLNGREAVMDAIRQSMVETEGTFKLVLTDVLSSDEHVVALVDFSAERHGGWMSGREIGVFRVSDGLITEVWFYTAEDPGRGLGVHARMTTLDRHAWVHAGARCSAADRDHPRARSATRPGVLLGCAGSGLSVGVRRGCADGHGRCPGAAVPKHRRATQSYARGVRGRTTGAGDGRAAVRGLMFEDYDYPTLRRSTRSPGSARSEPAWFRR